MVAASGSRRPLLAAVGALAMVGVAVLAFRASQTTLGTIRDCKSCGTRGQPLERGWVNVLPGDAWAVQLAPHAGVIVRGPARFEAAGGGRIALSSGAALLATSAGGRAVVMLPRDLQAGVEGASVAALPGARVSVSAAADGNAATVLSGAADVSATTGEKKLSSGQSWQTGKPPALAPPDATEAKWLSELAGE